MDLPLPTEVHVLLLCLHFRKLLLSNPELHQTIWVAAVLLCVCSGARDNICILDILQPEQGEGAQARHQRGVRGGADGDGVEENVLVLINF